MVMTVIVLGMWWFRYDEDSDNDRIATVVMMDDADGADAGDDVGGRNDDVVTMVEMVMKMRT